VPNQSIRLQLELLPRGEERGLDGPVRTVPRRAALRDEFARRRTIAVAAVALVVGD
jgi:hypothetical protein